VIFVGTSGWQYADWRERFYPRELPQREWLPYFAQRFATTEVNNTFYRLPEGSVFESWRRATPGGFTMAVKASRFITHVKRLKDPEEAVARLWERALLLGPRLGPILFQLPPRFRIDEPRLERLLSLLPSSMQAAFEFRDRSWLVPDVFELLDAHGSALVWADRPGVRHELPLIGGWGYLRLHQGSRVAPGYPRAKLRRLAELIVRIPARDVFVFFNNDQGGAAIRDAKKMTELLEGRGAEVAAAPGEG
jgi:uncharacterized protein YecE (DUF72 family)